MLTKKEVNQLLWKVQERLNRDISMLAKTGSVVEVIIKADGEEVTKYEINVEEMKKEQMDMENINLYAGIQ